MSISRRDFLRGVAVAGLVGGMSPALMSAMAPGRRKPNIVLILADDLGYETLGAYGGSSYKTPNIDRLAKEGMRFDHCYSQPLCTPSRVQLMTGIYNVRNYGGFADLPEKETTTAQLLRRAGYATCMVGKWQLGGGPGAPGHFGYDEHCLWQLTKRSTRYPNPGIETNGQLVQYSNGEYGPDIVGKYACDFVERHRDQPFHLYYSMILPHCPYEPTPDSKDWDPKSQGMEKSYVGKPQYFPDMVAYMDKMVGRLIENLDTLGLRDNTLVVFTGDNGCTPDITSEINGRKVMGGKDSTTDSGMRVPLIVNWPGVTAPGGVCKDLVDFTDFMPTICEVAGATVPTQLKIDGRSFWPQAQGKKGQPREWVYCWYSRAGFVSRCREFARDQRYKLYRTGEFYDIQNDVLEQNKLADGDLSAKVTEARKNLQAVLDRYAKARPQELLDMETETLKKEAERKKKQAEKAATKTQKSADPKQPVE